MAKFCKNCGTPLNDGATFCGKCGTPVNAAPAPGGYRPAPGPGGGPDLMSRLSVTGQPLKTGILASGVVMLLSVFLPFLTASFMGISESISLMSSEMKGSDTIPGFLFLLVAVAVIALELFDLKLFALVASGVSLLMNIINFFIIQGYLKESFGLMKRGFGCWLLILASIVATVLCVMDLLNARKGQ